MSRTTVDHPAGVGLSTARLRAGIEETVEAYRAIAVWAEWHADDIDPISGPDRDLHLVFIFPRARSVEAYHRLVAALPEIVPTGDLDSITPPSGPTATTDAKIGPVKVSIFAPAATCERVQVGTRLVEKPDPEAPTIKVEEPVYEYRCSEVAS